MDDGREPDDLSRPLDAELVDAWWTYHALAFSDDRHERLRSDEWSWAWAAVHHAVDHRTVGVVEFLVQLADAAAGDDERLAYLGAGPLETLLRFGTEPLSADVLDEVDAAARRNDSFRTALRCVWWGADDDPATLARVRRFGEPI